MTNNSELTNIPDLFRFELIVGPITAYGEPVTQGDHTVGFSRRNRNRVFIRHKNGKRLDAWRDVVAWTIKSAMRQARQKLPSGAVGVRIDFFYPHLKNHFTAKGNRSCNYATFKTSPPDGDKLQRAVFDALSGVAYEDDRCVVWSVWTKTFQNVATPGAVIRIYRVSESVSS